MEIIRRKICLEDLISRKSPINLDGKTISLSDDGCLVVQTKDVILENPINIDFNWGKINVDSFNINIFLTQNIDDMGIYLDTEYVDEEPDYSILKNYYLTELPNLTWTEPLSHNQVFNGPYTPDQKLLYRLRGQTASDYYFSSGVITGITDSTLNIVKSYDNLNPYRIGFNLNSNPSQYYTGVISVDTNSVNYVVDALANKINETGIRYSDTNIKRTIYDDVFKLDKIINTTFFSFSDSGWNESNTSLSANLKEELDLGIVFPHEIDNDVFIDRGVNSVLENQIKLSEIKNLSQLERYGNGFFNVKKQY